MKHTEEAIQYLRDVQYKERNPKKKDQQVKTQVPSAGQKGRGKKCAEVAHTEPRCLLPLRSGPHSRRCSKGRRLGHI